MTTKIILSLLSHEVDHKALTMRTIEKNRENSVVVYYLFSNNMNLYGNEKFCRLFHSLYRKIYGIN